MCTKTTMTYAGCKERRPTDKHKYVIRAQCQPRRHEWIAAGGPRQFRPNYSLQDNVNTGIRIFCPQCNGLQYDLFHNVKRKAESSKDNAPDLDNILRKEGLKAQNALLAHHDALEKLPELEKETERQENCSSDDISQASTQQPITRTDVICTSTSVLAQLQQSLAAYTDPTERQRVVLERFAHLLRLLLQQRTTVDLSAPPGAAEQQQAQSANQQQPTATTDGPQHKNDAVPAESSPLNHAEMHDSGYGSGTNPRTPDMGRPARGLKPTATAFPAEEWIENPERVQNHASRSPLPDRSKPAKPADDALFLGWLKIDDGASGRFHYDDVQTQKAPWEVPSATICDVPTFDRKSTPIPQSTTESAGLNAEEISTRFFRSGGYGADKPNMSDTMVRDPNACRACNERGGRHGKIMACKHCGGCAFVPRMGQHGPLLPGSLVLCPECNGHSDVIKQKFRCKVCKGTKKQPWNSSYEPEPKPYRDNYYEEPAPQQLQAPSGQQMNMGGDETEQVQCASE
ncbi:hypothetical protein EPUS_05963 [Endocarpon pusillum Z07020]|uniref:Uncharacterized protein n=1 Tax=Endocarpon pusillum (strain Z07020 / HMAS-L-300199) TaxID=1263415 RepID=U1GBJ1_ENDPU|nr:uncharacterized protein EPUS_05963 [Endocarpon pusillum Z07020]ERF69418.1 hypothetical protein EPUS_05963 [Endocarpon pusillum Z07020]